MSDPTNAARTVAVACDHAGPALRRAVLEHLQARGLQTFDLGTDGPDAVDYPDMADAVAAALADGRAALGVLICGTGIGISIAANRHAHVRAALCAEPASAALARRHNDANVLALGARMIGPELALACLDAFIDAEFEGGRHARRVAKLGPRGAVAT